MTDRRTPAHARTPESTAHYETAPDGNMGAWKVTLRGTHIATVAPYGARSARDLARRIADALNAADGHVPGRDGKMKVDPGEAGRAAHAALMSQVGPDDISEARRIIGGLLDSGFQPGLVERAQRWMDRAEAGQIGEPLHGLALDLAGDLSDLIEQSEGVYGLHQNGDPAPWGELLRGGRYENWLSSFDRMRDLLTGKAGKCRVCGCTDEAACEGGCSWANDEQTLCTRCAGDDASGGLPSWAAPEETDVELPLGEGSAFPGRSVADYLAPDGGGAVLLVASEGTVANLPPPRQPEVPTWTLEVNGVAYRTDQRHVRGKLGGCLVEAMWDGRTTMAVKVGPHNPGPPPVIIYGLPADDDGCPKGDPECLGNNGDCHDACQSPPGWGEAVHPVDALKSFAQSAGGDLDPAFEAAARAHCDEMVPFTREPPMEGLECMKGVRLGPGYSLDAGGRPVHDGGVVGWGVFDPKDGLWVLPDPALVEGAICAWGPEEDAGVWSDDEAHRIAAAVGDGMEVRLPRILIPARHGVIATANSVEIRFNEPEVAAECDQVPGAPLTGSVTVDLGDAGLGSKGQSFGPEGTPPPAEGPCGHYPVGAIVPAHVRAVDEVLGKPGPGPFPPSGGLTRGGRADSMPVQHSEEAAHDADPEP